jgi:arsenate reductase-like glutaredoxin family protein
LREKGVELEERDYAKQPLTKAELEELIDANNVSAFLNTRHQAFKSSGWKEKPPTKAQAIAAILKDSNLIRRPIVTKSRQRVVGFDNKAYAKL